MIPFVDIRSLITLLLGASLILAGGFVVLSGELSSIGSASSWVDLAAPQLPDLPAPDVEMPGVLL